MKFLKYALPCTMLLLAACGNKENTANNTTSTAAPISDNKPSYTFEKLPFNYDISALPEGTTYDISSILVKGNNAEAIAKINAIIEKEVKLNIANEESQIGNKSIQDLINEEIAAWVEESKTEYYRGFEKQLSYKGRQTQDLVVIEESSYSMTGGAHGNGYDGYLNFKASTGELIEDYQIFKDTSAVKDIIFPHFLKEAAAFFETQIDPKDLNAAGFQFEDNKFTLSNEITIDDKHVIFFYNAYEIGPYVMGTFELRVPKAELAAQLAYQ